MKKYKALLFDFDDTLFDFPKSERIALERVFSHYKIEKSEKNTLAICKRADIDHSLSC